MSVQSAQKNGFPLFIQMSHDNLWNEPSAHTPTYSFPMEWLNT